MEQNKLDISGIALVSVYAHNFEESFKFYNEIIGLKEFNPMGSDACYFTFGKNGGMYLIGGHHKFDFPEKIVRTTFAFEVFSTLAMFNHLVLNNILTIQSEPMKMNTQVSWFQCYDPSGNILEFCGGIS
jgi:predicted enzyme related to lactoylglutathione lyase